MRRSVAAPRPASELGRRRRLGAGLPRRAGRRGFTEVHTPKFVATATESGANVFGVDWFGRGLPRAVPAVLQAAPGRGLRAGLRGRAGVPRRTARHGAAPRPVRLDRRRARVHPGPPGRARGAPRLLAGMVERRRRARRPVERTPGHARVPAELPSSTSPRRCAVGAPEDEPDLAPEHERALGAWARGVRFATSLPWRASLEAAVLHPPAPGDPAGRTASTCSSAGSSWSPVASGCTSRRLRRGPRGRGEDPAASRRTSNRSVTACRRTAASRSGSTVDGRAGQAADVRASRSSHGTCTASPPDGGASPVEWGA